MSQCMLVCVHALRRSRSNDTTVGGSTLSIQILVSNITLQVKGAMSDTRTGTGQKQNEPGAYCRARK